MVNRRRQKKTCVLVSVSFATPVPFYFLNYFKISAVRFLVSFRSSLFVSFRFFWCVVVYGFKMYFDSYSNHINRLYRFALMGVVLLRLCWQTNRTRRHAIRYNLIRAQDVLLCNIPHIHTLYTSYTPIWPYVYYAYMYYILPYEISYPMMNICIYILYKYVCHMYVK